MLRLGLRLREVKEFHAMENCTIKGFEYLTTLVSEARSNLNFRNTWDNKCIPLMIRKIVIARGYTFY